MAGRFSTAAGPRDANVLASKRKREGLGLGGARRGRFGTRSRLKEEQEFRALLKARRRLQTDYFFVHVLSNGLDYARLGVVASKRIAPHAVDRNFAKRLVRERFRLKQEALRGLDVLVRLRRKVLKQQSRAISQELTDLFSQLS